MPEVAGASPSLPERLARLRRECGTLEAELAPDLDRTRRGVETLAALDRQHGEDAPLALEGTGELVSAILRDLARIAAAAERGDAPAVVDGSDAIALGVALWACRHGVAHEAVEPVVNALARRANAARTPEALAAAFRLTQGVIALAAPRLAADLEQSDPQRPWRLLHVNLAFTAIRSEDGALVDEAFDALERALPGERAAFFAEANALAAAPGIAPAVRERIAARHLKWTAAR